ncbi:hypothetical protein HMPREF9413_5070 [Paenibacillus sp. HGF7]|nr:hypothetical protein HMPREF9413_5070 [Paenibacillus sp. HGF7]
MIKNLYETHLQVKDLNTSIEFYNKLGLELSLLIEERGIAFFILERNVNYLVFGKFQREVMLAKDILLLGLIWIY